MSRRRYRWHSQPDTDRSDRSDRFDEPDSHDLADDVARWVASYLDGSRGDGRESSRSARRPFTRDDFDALFEDAGHPSQWPEEVHEHLAALRDRLHGISARQYGRRSARGDRWRRHQRDAGHGDAGEPRRASGRPSRMLWVLATRLAVMVIMAVVARKRAERSRRGRGFSV
ncbi:MAG: hypothetical protein EPO65_01270 [Dehalococcoidia bacterium]|nr:MAG: hypothetical protein EPO65_01270 [Dehalococcoidia bacterium]